MMKTNHIKWLFALLIIISLFSGYLPIVYAEANPDFTLLENTNNENIVSDCYALDIIFIVDQSGSMSGQRPDGSRIPPNDPLQQRVYAPRYALDWLANNRMGLCPLAIHRMGVISFGTTVEVDLPLTPIQPNNQSDWEIIRPGLEQKITARNLSATDPALAFQEAKTMLSGVGDLGDLPRKKAIILLTDGSPCVGMLGCNLNNDVMDHDAYNRDFLEQVAQDFGFVEALRQRDGAILAAALTYGGIDRIPDEDRNRILTDNPITKQDLADSTYIWVIAMNAAEPYIDEDGDLFESIGTQHGGDLIDLEENLSDVPAVFNTIMSQLAGVSPRLLGCGNLAVNPYLAGAVLDVYKVGEGYDVIVNYGPKSITAGTGDTDFFGVQQYSEFGAIEHYRFSLPPAGLWTVDASDCRGVQASFIPFTADVQMVEPQGILPQYNLNGENFDAQHPNYLKFKVVDQVNNLILKNNPDYPLSISATITDPDGEKFTTTSFTYREDGTWEGTDAVPVQAIGTYIVDITASATCVVDPEDPENCPTPTFEVFRKSDFSYSVGEVSLFNVEISSPANGDTIPLHGTLIQERLADQPVKVIVQLTDSQGIPIARDTVLPASPSMEQIIRASLSSGNEIQEIFLLPDLSDTSKFIGEFTLPTVVGQYNLVVEVTDYNFEQYRPYQNPVMVTFTRRDPLLQNPVFYKILSGLLGLMILGVIIAIIYSRTNPVRGRLEFTNVAAASGSSSRKISIGRGKRRVVINKGLSDLGLRRIDASNASAKGGKQIVNVVFYPLKGNKILRQLTDGTGIVTINNWNVQYIWGGKPRR